MFVKCLNKYEVIKSSLDSILCNICMSSGVEFFAYLMKDLLQLQPFSPSLFCVLYSLPWSSTVLICSFITALQGGERNRSGSTFVFQSKGPGHVVWQCCSLILSLVVGLGGPVDIWPRSGVAGELQGGLRTRGWLRKMISKRQSKTEADQRDPFQNLLIGMNSEKPSADSDL